MKILIKFYWIIQRTRNKFINKLVFFRKNIIYKEFPIISGVVIITGQGYLKLGNKVKFNSSRRSNPIGGDTKMIIDLGTSGYLKIGNNTGISNTTIVAHKKVIIGNNVKIGGSVKIYDTDFHSLDVTKRLSANTDVPIKKEIILKDGAFMGAHSLTQKGVTIGKNVIVGAGSVVTKNIPDNEIWGGNPAKYIKKIERINY